MKQTINVAVTGTIVVPIDPPDLAGGEENCFATLDWAIEEAHKKGQEMGLRVHHHIASACPTPSPTPPKSA